MLAPGVGLPLALGRGALPPSAPPAADGGSSSTRASALRSVFSRSPCCGTTTTWRPNAMGFPAGCPRPSRCPGVPPTSPPRIGRPGPLCTLDPRVGLHLRLPHIEPIQPHGMDLQKQRTFFALCCRRPPRTCRCPTRSTRGLPTTAAPRLQGIPRPASTAPARRRTPRGRPGRPARSPPGRRTEVPPGRQPEGRPSLNERYDEKALDSGVLAF